MRVDRDDHVFVARARSNAAAITRDDNINNVIYADRHLYGSRVRRQSERWTTTTRSEQRFASSNVVLHTSANGRGRDGRERRERQLGGVRLRRRRQWCPVAAQRVARRKNAAEKQRF